MEASFRAITRQKKTSISRRVIKTGVVENEHPKDQVKGAKFLYAKGIVRQPVRNTKKAFGQAGIDTLAYMIFRSSANRYARFSARANIHQ